MNGGSLVVEVLFNGLFWLWALALIPAAVVTLLKGRWLHFLTGWVSFGIAWLIAALSLADPDSRWARRFYGPERTARARDPEHHPQPEREAGLWVYGSLALLVVVGLLASRPTLVTGVQGDALQYSVGNGNLGSSVPACDHEGGRSWSCLAYDSGFSSTVPYRVEVGRLGCWTATLVGTGGGEGADEHRSGCVTIWDRVRPFDAVF